MAKPRYIFTKEERHAIVTLYQNGKSIEEIAKIFDTKKSTFIARIQKNGLSDQLKETRLTRNEKLKDNLYNLCFERETTEYEYHYVPRENKETGKIEYAPQLRKKKVRMLPPNDTALKICTINMLRWATGANTDTISLDMPIDKEKGVYIMTGAKGKVDAFKKELKKKFGELTVSEALERLNEKEKEE